MQKLARYRRFGHCSGRNEGEVYCASMASPRDAYRRRQARRSTLFAVVGLVLIASGVVLTLTGGVGNVVPTVLAIVGLVSLVAGMAAGSLLVFENFRYSRNQSYYDEDQDE